MLQIFREVGERGMYEKVYTNFRAGFTLVEIISWYYYRCFWLR